MTQPDRRRMLAFLGAAGLVGACAMPEIADRDGTDPFEGGIGGTGIVGTVTGTGALMVNGLELATPAGTRIRSRFGGLSRDALAPGQTLTISAQRGRDGFEARDITIDHALVGRVGQAGRGVTVNGVPVAREPGAYGVLIPGARVAVSGLWRADGTLLASRVDAAPSAPDLVAGTVTSRGDGRFSVGPVPIAPRGSVPVDGSYAVAVGRMAGPMLEAERVEMGRFTMALPLLQLSIEGYLEPAAARPGYRVAGLGHSFARDLQLGRIGPARAIYFGPYDGRFGAEAAYILPEGVAARRRLLSPGVTGGFAGRVLPV